MANSFAYTSHIIHYQCPEPGRSLERVHSNRARWLNTTIINGTSIFFNFHGTSKGEFHGGGGSVLATTLDTFGRRR